MVRLCSLLGLLAHCQSEDGTSTDEPAPYLHVFREGGYSSPQLDECDTDASCPDGARCFRLTEELGFCSIPEPEPESTTCLVRPGMQPSCTEACGCDDKTCPPGLLCVSRSIRFGCGPPQHNECVEPRCETEADCPSDQVCLPRRTTQEGTAGDIQAPRCAEPQCRSDSECQDGPGGRCGIFLQPPEQPIFGQTTFSRIGCAYWSSTPRCKTGTPQEIGNYSLLTFYICR